MSLRTSTAICVLIGLSGCGASVGIAFDCLWQIPPNTPFRHLGLPILLVFAALLVFALELAVAVVCGFTQRRRHAIVAWIAVLVAPVLCLACGLAASYWIMAVHGLTPET
jgi:hypothetical protein